MASGFVTITELEMAKELRAQHYTWAEIGKELGRHKDVIRKRFVAVYGEDVGTPKYANRRDRVKCEYKSFTPEEVEELLQLKAEGYTWSEIAEALNRSRSSVASKYWTLDDSYTHRKRADSDMLCWECRKASNPDNSCPWVAVNEETDEIRFEEVPGWKTVPVPYRYQNEQGIKDIVVECPLFERG